MSHTLHITEGPVDPEFNRRTAQYRRNGEWLTAQDAAFLKQFSGQYIAVSEGEVFVADDAWKAQRLAREKHPDDEPFIQ